MFVVMGLAVAALSVYRLRRSSTGSRWPYLASAGLAGLTVVLSAGGVLVALAVGRTTWNGWTAGTPQRESMTLSVLFMGFPLLLALGVLLLLIGSLSQRRHRLHATRTSP